MIGPLKPFVQISLNGVPTGLEVGSGLRDFEYRDVHHGEVDEIRFEVADPNGLWRAGWGPDEGDELTATVGYGDLGVIGTRLECGQFAIGENEARGDGDGSVASFFGQSAFTSKELRTERSVAYDEFSLADIIEQIASRHGLSVVGEIPDLTFQRISQDRQSDLRFLTRLADDWGCYFSVKGSLLVFTSRESIEAATPARMFDLETSPIKSWGVVKATKDLFANAEAKYLHPKTRQILTAEASDARVKSGDTLKLDDRCETQAHAERLCAARLARENDRLGTGFLTVPGDPALVAGLVVALGSSFGRYAGRYLVTVSSHELSSAGYTTRVRLKLI